MKITEISSVNDEIVEKKVTVKVGDGISFKADYEQDGVITRIRGYQLTVKSSDSETGDDIYHDLIDNDCWIEA